jgi:hypothetical protein
MTTRGVLVAACLVAGCSTTTTFNIAAPVNISAPVGGGLANPSVVASPSAPVPSTSPVAPPAAASAPPAPPPSTAPTAPPQPSPPATPKPLPEGDNNNGLNNNTENNNNNNNINNNNNNNNGGNDPDDDDDHDASPAPSPAPSASLAPYPPSTLTGYGDPDARNLKRAETTASSGNTTRFGETFKVSRDGRLGAVSVMLATLNNQPGPNTVISIHATDSDGFPVDPPLGSAVLPGADIYVPQGNFLALYGAPTTLLPVTFATPIPLTANTLYAWAIQPQGPEQYPGLFGTYGDTYGDGRAVVWVGSWRAHDVISDFVFETFLLDP